MKLYEELREYRDGRDIPAELLVVTENGFGKRTPVSGLFYDYDKGTDEDVPYPTWI